MKQLEQENSLTLNSATQPITISFLMKEKIVFTVHPDGSITKGEGFTTEEEASLHFWEILNKMYPRFLLQASKTEA